MRRAVLLLPLVLPLWAEEAPSARAEIDACIGRLGDASLEVREQAQTRLMEIGPPALDPVRLALKESKDAEIRERCRRLLPLFGHPERLKLMQEHPDLSERVEALLEAYPEACVLVFRATVSDGIENGVIKPAAPLEGLKVAFGTSCSITRDLVHAVSTDAHGIWVACLAPDQIDVDFVICDAPARLGELASLLPEPTRFRNQPGSFVLLSDLRYVPTLVLLSPALGERFRAPAKPHFSWKPYPGAASYKVKVSRVTMRTQGQTFPGYESVSEFEVPGTLTEADWKRVIACADVEHLPKGFAWTGGFLLLVTPLGQKGEVLSGGSARAKLSFHLDLQKGEVEMKSWGIESFFVDDEKTAP